MAIWNLGSINADMVYAVPHLPSPGETLAAISVSRYLGGKGANMSVAAARAAAHVCHIGAVGEDGRWAVERLTEYGVDTRFIETLATVPTGHAVIAVDRAGENQIVICPGANAELSMARVGKALTAARAGDWFLCQNETNAQVEAARMAHARGLNVAYAAAPFSAAAVQAMLPFLDLLILNAVEAAQLEAATGMAPETLPVAHVIVTRGGDGARYFDTDKGEGAEFPAIPVDPVDTTGAGDTFAGYVLAGLDRGMPIAQAIARATRAAAIMVTREGTADAIPDLRDIQDRFGPG